METDRPNLAARAAKVVGAALLGGLAAACGGEPEEAPPRRPDVVLICIDTLRADRMSCYGYPRPTTPTLDRLAKEGARFEDVTAQSSWTLPSMVSMFSGQYLTAYRDKLDPKVPTLAETFRGAGYRTVGVVGNILMQPHGGFDRGFDHYDARTAENEPGDDRARARMIDVLAKELWGPLDEALAVDENGERPPLFLYLHPFDPHNPYTGKEHLEAELPREGALPVLPEEWPLQVLKEWGPPAPGGLKRKEIHALRGLYDQDVRYTDEQLGLILERLEELGVLANCVVAVVSDHGEGLWDRLGPMPREELKNQTLENFFYQQHGAYLYQEAVFTPFLLWGAGVPAGTLVELPVENVDLFPTLLELCDVPARHELHGRSLVPLLRGERPYNWRHAVFSDVLYSQAIRDVRTGDKLIVPTEHGRKAGATDELYRIRTDWLERENLVDVDPDTTEHLKRRLERWRAKYPTRTTLGDERTDEQERLMGALGYGEAHGGD